MNWTLRIDHIPPSGNVVMRMHWRVYHRLLEDWFLLVRGAGGFLDIPTARGKRRVTVVRYGRRTLDDENLAFSTKPIFDVLRPEKVEEGVYKSGKHKGEPWRRKRLGHGLILEDDPTHVERRVLNGKLRKGERPYTLLILEEVAP